MTRGSWTIQKKVADVWTADGTIYPPNDNLSHQKNSTQVPMNLDDGSLAYITPSTKYLDGNLIFVWYWEDGTMKTKIDAYIENGDDLKIIDHDANEYIGRFIMIDSVQLVGQDPDRYDTKATFTIMPDLA